MSEEDYVPLTDFTYYYNNYYLRSFPEGCQIGRIKLNNFDRLFKSEYSDRFEDLTYDYIEDAISQKCITDINDMIDGIKNNNSILSYESHGESRHERWDGTRFDITKHLIIDQKKDAVKLYNYNTFLCGIPKGIFLDLLYEINEITGTDEYINDQAFRYVKYADQCDNHVFQFYSA